MVEKLRKLTEWNKIKNSYIRGGLSDVGAITYYEKTTRLQDSSM